MWPNAIEKNKKLSFTHAELRRLAICIASDLCFVVQFIFSVNVSLFSLYMRTGVFLVFYCLIIFLLCALCVFRHC